MPPRSRKTSGPFRLVGGVAQVVPVISESDHYPRGRFHLTFLSNSAEGSTVDVADIYLTRAELTELNNLIYSALYQR